MQSPAKVSVKTSILINPRDNVPRQLWDSYNGLTFGYPNLCPSSGHFVFSFDLKKPHERLQASLTVTFYVSRDCIARTHQHGTSSHPYNMDIRLQRQSIVGNSYHAYRRHHYCTHSQYHTLKFIKICDICIERVFILETLYIYTSNL